MSKRNCRTGSRRHSRN